MPSPFPAPQTSAALAEARGFARYLAAGALSFAADYSVFSLLIGLFGAHEQLANGVSRPIGGIVCFLLNKHWTFAGRGREPAARQLLRFAFVFAASLGLVAGLIWLFHRGLGMDAYTAKLLAEAIAVVFNYFSLKLWTFR